MFLPRFTLGSQNLLFGSHLARVLQSTNAEFEDVDFVINCKLFLRHIWFAYQFEYSGNDALDRINVQRLAPKLPSFRVCTDRSKLDQRPLLGDPTETETASPVPHQAPCSFLD